MLYHSGKSNKHREINTFIFYLMEDISSYSFWCKEYFTFDIIDNPEEVIIDNTVKLSEWNFYHKKKKLFRKMVGTS